MEKLQQALSKARSQRQATVVSNPAGPTSSAAALWAALTPFEPVPATLERNRVVTLSAGGHANTFDLLRTKVVLQMRKNGWKRLAITSPTASCGKSTLCCNLAVGLSRQPDIRTILFELDLRRPNLGRILGLRPARDITEMLTGRVAFAEQALRLHDNVALSAATQSVRDPMQFLLSAETDQRLSEIENAYEPDLMIFDLPPILAADDTRAVLSKADCALIVARAEKTTVAQIDSCEREIAEHTNVLGVVLNQCRFSDTTDVQPY